MHYLVRLIVPGDTVEEATAAAISVAEDLVEKFEFDWFNDNAEDSRWFDCLRPASLDSEEGQKWVEDGLQAQFADFEESMQTIRTMVERYSNEQIFNEEFVQESGHFFSRWQFSHASGYHSNACYLYGMDGEQILNRSELDKYFTNTASLWVVQVDCHN